MPATSSTIAEAPARAERCGLDATEAPAPRRRGWLTAPARRELILALLLVLCYGFFHQVPSWNEYSRYDLVLAIVDDRSLSIDPYHKNTGDKARYNGRYYSTKAPGTALLGVPVYALLRAAAPLAGADRPDPELVMHALAFTVAGIPTVVLTLLLLRFLRPLVGEWWALAVAAGYGLGTIAFPFASWPVTTRLIFPCIRVSFD
jgi:hypothetical protein